MWKLVQIVGALLVVIYIVGRFSENQQQEASGVTPTRTILTEAAAAPAPTVPMPADEANVVAAVQVARQLYNSAANDMAKGASRPARARALCAALRNPSVTGWVGHVTSLSSNGDGKGVLAIEIAPDVTVTTWNNSLSDYADHSLIEPSSNLFASASQLQKGQLVRFDGTFSQSPTDCLKESSMTLEGSISEPDFIFRFRSIAAIQ